MSRPGGSSRQRRSPLSSCGVNARDVARSAIVAGDKGRTGQSYLLTGHHVGLREIADRIASITGKRSPLFTEESLAVINAGVRFSHALAAEELGHAPREFAATLADTLRWFYDTGRLR